MRTSTRLAFDRGTLLLDRFENDGAVLAAVPDVRFDARVERYRAPAHRLESVRDALDRRGIGVEVPPPARRLGPVGRFGAIELRPYQDAALGAWAVARRRGVVVLPTGAGKTRLAIGAIARARAPAICLVPTRVLLEQWRREIARVYSGPVGCLGDGSAEIAPITVSTFESAYRRMPEIGDRFGLLVVDEAHHFGQGQRDEALEMCTASARLGLTATPPRMGAPASEALEALVGPIVFELAIGDLAGRFLAEFDLVILELHLSPDERAAYAADTALYRAALERFQLIAPEGNWPSFARSAARTEDGREALRAFQRTRRLLSLTRAKAAVLEALLDRHRDSRVLVFTADNAAAYAVARRFLVMPLTCDIGRAERDAALAAFRAGTLRALVSSRVLNEGLDVPDADVAIVVGGTQGEREHVQRVGRCLRPRDGKRAIVYELVTRGTFEVRQGRRRRHALDARPRRGRQRA